MRESNTKGATTKSNTPKLGQRVRWLALLLLFLNHSIDKEI